jgi:hypothetical protein
MLLFYKYGWFPNADMPFDFGLRQCLWADDVYYFWSLTSKSNISHTLARKSTGPNPKFFGGVGVAHWSEF